jgi:sigma-E factor negative regulatory protein RseC
MIEQQGRIVAVAHGFARVRLGGMSGCPSCDEGKGCGAGVFGKLLRRHPVELELENGIGALNGQGVMVGISERLFLRLVYRFYLFPLLAGLAGAAVAYYLSGLIGTSQGSADAVTLLGGLTCAAAAVLVNRKFAMEFPEQIIVHLLRVI